MLFPQLLLTYPLVLHLGIYFGHIDLVVFYLVILLCLPFLSTVIKRVRPGVWHILALGLAFIVLVIPASNDQLIIKLIPLIVNGVLLWFFASTLVAGRVPLVTRFASLMRKDMPPAVLIYTRRATVAWSCYFLGMLILSLILAIYAPIELWSFFSNVLSYVFLMLMFLVEYIVRRLLMHEYMDYSFTEFVQRLRQVNFLSVFRR